MDNFTDHNFYWFIAQLGLLLEVTGALYIVVASLRARSRVQRLFSGWQGMAEIPKVLETIQNQAKTEIVGFLILAAGLLLQFLGGFGY